MEGSKIGQRENLMCDTGMTKLWSTPGGTLEHIPPISISCWAEIAAPLKSVTGCWLPFQGVSLSKMPFAAEANPEGADGWDDMLPPEGELGGASPCLLQLVSDMVEIELEFC